MSALELEPGLGTELELEMGLVPGLEMELALVLVLVQRRRQAEVVPLKQVQQDSTMLSFSFSYLHKL
jgi:hypothetical protein